MFIETNNGRLQNLYLLQDVRTIKNEEDNKYAVAFIQANGVVIKEGAYETEEEAEAVRQEEVAKLLATREE